MNSFASIHAPAIRHRRKRRNPSIASGIRRKYGIPASPLFPLKLHNKRSTVSATMFPVSFQRDFEKSELSARRLAACLWHSRFKYVSGDGGGNGRASLEDWTSFRSSKCEIELTSPCLKCCKEEESTELWDPSLSEKSYNSTHIESSNLFRDRKLRAEYFHAHRYINKHEAAPKEEEEEEEMSWKGREFQKIQFVLHFLKDKLARERRSRKKMESLSRSLLNELEEANLSAKQSMKKYEKEKRDREQMEQLCNELAKQRVEDKANLEELQKKLVKIREKAEEEKIMLKKSELWSEEQVQIKLEDAKFVIEDWHNQMMQLIGNLEGFLRSRGAELGILHESEAEAVTIGVERDKSTIKSSSVVSASERGGFGQRKWRSDAMNPHVTRGIKGLLEWPPLNLKNNFKPIPLEARVRKQKSQLQLMLKPNA